MDRATLFISDLHLDPVRPHITELFLSFLSSEAAQAQSLYILGDLFEVWLGDDDDDPQLERIVAALQDLTADGVPVRFMHGNRDFLVGDGFAERSGCALLPESTVIDLYGIPTLLMHGDTLCTDDLEYQAFRSMVRNAEWQRGFLSLPLAERRRQAAAARAESRRRTGEKPAEIMDVNPQAVVEAMREHGVYQLIHGHTHRPAIHEFVLDGVAASRIVLGDWYEQGSVLRCTAGDCRLERLEPSQD